MRLTQVEILVLLLSLILLGIVVLPFIMQVTKQRPVKGWNRCRSNVRQVAMAQRLWAGDNNDKFPFEVSTNLNGTMEFVQAADAFRHFQVLSNELSSPRVLTCPADAIRQPAADFASLGNGNLSYFINLSARERGPVSALSGDRNLQLSGPGTTTAVKWGSGLHEKWGFVALTDGSVWSPHWPEKNPRLSAFFTNAQLLFPP